MSPVKVEYEGKSFFVNHKSMWAIRGGHGRTVSVNGEEDGGIISLLLQTPRADSAEDYENVEFPKGQKLEGQVLDPRTGKLNDIKLEFT